MSTSNPYQNFIDPLIRRGGHVMCAIDGLTFHINPSTYRQSTQRVQQMAPTRAGVVRFSYGVQAITYELEGFTGTAGVNELEAMERFRPLVGHQDRLVTFTFPSRFREIRKVYVNRFDDSITSDMHLYNQYTIELVDLGPQQPSSVVQLANNAQAALNISLLPGGGGQIISAPTANTNPTRAH